jgi:hypothetical protein
MSMRTVPGRRTALPLALATGLATFLLAGPRTEAAANDLSGFSVMPQLGDSSAPGAIGIAPDGRWFLTANPGAIYLSDLDSGAVLRRLIPHTPGRLTRVAISKDGNAVVAKLVPDEGADEILGWSSETGLPIAHAETAAPPPDAPDWNWIERQWPKSNVAPYDFSAPQKYLVDQKIDRLVDVSRVERVEPTNHRNVDQVTVAGEDHDPDENFAAYRYYFIDVVQKKVLVDVPGKTLNTFCGQPNGAFAFDGHHLLITLDELADVAGANINSMIVDTAAKPPFVEWSSVCQDFRVAGMFMRRGLIVVSASPDKVTIWDPATARQVARLHEIHDSEVLEWSRDLTTFATGFHESLDQGQGNKFGISVLRSGNKRFIPTDRAILEIRFNPDGNVLFARTEAGWAAWNTSNETSLPSDGLPPSEEDLDPLNAPDIASPDGKFRIVDHRRLVDAASGRVLVTAPNPLSFSEGTRYVWTWSNVHRQSIIVWDTASGQRLWTATANDTNSDDFLIMEFPDGRVRLSEGAERLVRLVRGFEVRPFDDAAKRIFLSP